MNTIDLQGKKVLIRPGIAELANKNNVVIGESREKRDGNRNSGRQVVLEKQLGGKEVIRITIRNPAGGNQLNKRSEPTRKLPDHRSQLGTRKLPNCRRQLGILPSYKGLPSCTS